MLCQYYHLSGIVIIFVSARPTFDDETYLRRINMFVKTIILVSKHDLLYAYETGITHTGTKLFLSRRNKQ